MLLSLQVLSLELVPFGSCQVKRGAQCDVDTVLILQLTDAATTSKGESYTMKELESFNYWLSYFIKSSQSGEFLKSVEEWKKLAFPRLSETLFVVITFIFEKLLPEYYNAEQS